MAAVAGAYRTAVGLVTILAKAHGRTGLDGQHSSVGQAAVAGYAGNLFFHMQAVIGGMDLAEVLAVFAKVFCLVAFETVFVGDVGEEDRPTLAAAKVSVDIAGTGQMGLDLAAQARF